MKTFDTLAALMIAASTMLLTPFSVSAAGADNDNVEDRSFSMKGDASQGRKVFIRCRACHNLTDDRRHKTGPNLNALFGRVSGTSASYQTYSKAMKDAQIVWTEANLNEYLAKPRTYLPGNKMVFAGITNDKDRFDLLAYLRQSQDNVNK